MNHRILRFQQLKTLIGFSRATIARLEEQGLFPRRIQLSINSIGWLESDILEWLNQKKSAANVGDEA